MCNLFMFPPTFTEMLMDSTTATAELGWTVYPVSGTSDNSVSFLNVSILQIIFYCTPFTEVT